MKKFNFLFLLTIALSFAGISNAQTFAGGAGTVSDPYLIATPAHMLAMHDVDAAITVYYKMTADVDMTGVNWTPLNIATGNPRVVHFDGNGHLIKNLTVNGTASYMSLFGVLRGSCRNLGVVGALITSTGGGAGIIAGYAGLKTPSNASFTGMIENCFTTGSVTGSDAVGGIVGNIGKPFGTTDFSGVRNCYSTANVTATNTTTSARAGGVVGINYAKGIIENCHATGAVTSKGIKGAGGIVGWTDSDLISCVAFNAFVKNEKTGNVGRVSANMGLDGVVAKGINCWASGNVVVDNAGVIRAEAEMFSVDNTVRDLPYDGITKTASYLSNFSNFETELGWNFTGANNIWSTNTSTGYPMLQWYVSSIVSGTSSSPAADIRILVTHNTVLLNASDRIGLVKVRDASGRMMSSTVVNAVTGEIILPAKGVYILSVELNGSAITQKVII